MLLVLSLVRAKLDCDFALCDKWHKYKDTCIVDCCCFWCNATAMCDSIYVNSCPNKDSSLSYNMNFGVIIFLPLISGMALLLLLFAIAYQIYIWYQSPNGYRSLPY